MKSHGRMGPTQYRRPPGRGQCGDALKLRTHAVVGIGLERLVG